MPRRHQNILKLVRRSFSTHIQTQQQSHAPISSLESVFGGLLHFCTKLSHTKQTHAQIFKSLLIPSLFLSNNLLALYCKYHDVRSAWQLFDGMPKRNTLSYNLVISGFSQMGQYKSALEVFVRARRDVEIDKFTYASVLNACGKNRDLKSGKIIHALSIVAGFEKCAFLVNSSINFYSKCGRIGIAEKIFENSSKVDEVSWNSLLSAFAQSSMKKEAFQIFVRMHRFGFEFNSFALGSAIKACLSLNFMEGLVEMIHACIIKIWLENNVFVGSAMIDLYAKKGRLHESIMVFKSILNPNVVVYNTIIASFHRTENYINDKEITNQALLIFSQMEREGIRPSEITFASVLCACNLAHEFEFGKQIHAQIVKYNFETNEFIGSSLIEIYSNAGFISEAFKCFDLVSNKDIITYTSIISGCVQNKLHEKALVLFRMLVRNGKRPDLFTLSSTINACSNLGVARSGEQIQVWTTKLGLGFQKFIVVGNSCIAMYAKSGCFDEAVRVFHEMQFRDVVSWTAIISGHAQHGHAKPALKLFEEMEEVGVKANELTFLAVLTACCHAGLVNQGLRYYERMKQIYGLKPTIKHHSCIVDLLGKSGRISEVESFILNSDFKTDQIVERSLLSSCRLKLQHKSSGVIHGGKL